MKQTLLIAGAMALLASAPALAKPGNGHGSGNGKGSNSGLVHVSAHSQGKVHGKANKSHGKGTLYGYGQGGCPPGLARKNNGCLPPGQFKKLYSNGQRYPTNYGNQWSYNQIPLDLRSQYDLSRNSRYYYGDGYLYQVDPRTRLVQQVVNAIVR
ncbi:MAG: hypothetical protein H0W71_03500 [Sphingomonas sp.]|nr:hypothetical protein [Sphingomonas sp.]